MYPIVSILYEQSVIDGKPKQLDIYADGTIKGNLTGFKIVNYFPLISRRFRAFMNEMIKDYNMPFIIGSTGSSGESQEIGENSDNISAQNATDSGGK